MPNKVGRYLQACGWAAVLASGVVAPCLAQSSQAGAPLKWGPHIDFEGKLGNERSLGEADAFVPFWQNDSSLLFGNFRTRLDDDNGREGNFGLGLRHMLDSGWNLGAYGYYDRRKSENRNYFNQTTFGVEALSLDWDFRGNLYTPFGDRVKTLPGSSSGGASTASLVGSSVVVTTPAVMRAEEKSLTGYDAEIGWRVPLFGAEANQQLRVFGGAYRFYANEVSNKVQGPRGRAELTFDEVPYLWEGSRLTLGGEIQDDVRGRTGFATARLRIPLQVFGETVSKSKLTPMERRMADPIVRDIDIVSQSYIATLSPATTETATQTSGGSALTVLTTDTNGNGSLTNEFTTAGANSTVIISGTITTTLNSTLMSGQTVMGSGTLTVQTPSGKTASVTLSGGTISTTAIGAAGVLTTAANATVRDLTITQSLAGSVVGIVVSSTGVTISNVTLTQTATAGGNATGFNFSAGATATVSNNTISSTAAGDALALNVQGGSTGTISNNSATAVAGGGNIARALWVQSSTATVSGNTLSASGGGVNRHTSLDTATINGGSTGNTATGNCATNNAGTGSVSYTNAANCNAN